MITFTIDVPNERQLIARLDQFPMTLRAKLLPTITSLTQTLLGRVRAAEPARTGALREATRSFVDQGKDYVRGKVRVLPIAGRTPSSTVSTGRARNQNVAAAALEYGVNATFAVHSHRMRLAHVFDRRVDNRFVIVDTYRRKVSIPSRRFLRDPMAAMRPQATAEIQKALDEALAEVQQS